jgi:hypothetical protein
MKLASHGGHLFTYSTRDGSSMSISHITDKLILSSSPSQWKISQASPEASLSSTVDPFKDALRSFSLSLSPPFSPKRTRDVIKYLQEDGKLLGGYASHNTDDEEQALKDAVLGRLVAAIYAEALDTLLSEAINSEIEAQWWADLERSRLRVAYHLVQSASSSNSPLFVADCASSLTPPRLQSLRRCASCLALQWRAHFIFSHQALVNPSPSWQGYWAAYFYYSFHVPASPYTS